MTPSHCRDCNAPLVPWRRGERLADLPEGHQRHFGHGRCQGCQKAAARTGRLHRQPRLTRTAGEVLECWQALRRPPFDCSTAEVAAALGVTERAVTVAVWRARRRGDPRAVPGRDTRFKPAEPAVGIPVGWQWSNAQLFDLCTDDEGEAAV